MFQHNDRLRRTFRLFFTMFSFAVIAVLGVNAVSYMQTGVSKNCVVEEKKETSDLIKKRKMLVYTKNCGTFTIEDSIVDRRYYPENEYDTIQPGQVYNFKTRGISVPIFGMHPNILSLQEVV
jgi:hypothetical protein